MISIFREFTKTWAFKGLMLLLVIGFAIFGVNRFAGDSAGLSNDVISAKGRSISTRQFAALYENYRKQYEQEKGESFDAQAFVDEGQHQVILNQLADQTSLSAWLDSVRIKASTKLLVSKIAEVPYFVSSVTGKFDKDTYNQFLARQGVTVADYESSRRDGLALNQYGDAVDAGLKSPRIYDTAYVGFMLQNRDASFFVLSAQNVPNPGLPSDAQLTAFYKQHLEQLKNPEMRTASAVIFSPSLYEKDIQVDDAELHKMFETRRATLATPETRSFVQITAPDMGVATKIADALKSGQAPDAVAKANKGQVITYTLKARTAVADAKVADAAFALQSGQVSAPVKGELGIAVIKMGEIKTGSTPSFEGVRETLAAEYRKDKAATKMNEVSNAFSDAINKGEDFDATAARLNLPVQHLAPMRADGMAAGGNNYAQFGPLVKAVFDLQQPGSASDVQAFGGQEYFSVKLVSITPAGAPPLDQVRGPLTQGWQQQQVSDALDAKVKEARARLAKGESVAAVAAAYGVPVQPVKNLTQQAYQQNRQFARLGGAIFDAKLDEDFQAPVADFAIALGRLDAIHQVDPGMANMQSLSVSAQVGNSLRSDIVELTTKNARKVTKTKTNVNAALAVMNVTPTAAKDAKDGKDAKKDSKSKS